MQAVWDFLVAHQAELGTIAGVLVLVVAAWLRGMTKEQVGHLLGDVIALVVSALHGVIADTPHELILAYAGVVYDNLNLLLKVPLLGLVVTIYKKVVSREQFGEYALAAWHNFVERRAPAETILKAKLKFLLEAYQSKTV